MDKRLRERRRQVNRERGRRRGGLIFLGALVLLAVVAFLWLRSSSVFAVQQVTASVTQHVTEQQIAEAVAPARGVSLLKLSTKDIEKRLSELPYVKEIHVYRRFPDGLDVRVVEREPIARVETGGRTWLVSGDGRLLEKVSKESFMSLPLVVGSGEFEARTGDRIPQTMVGALSVATLLETEDMISRLPALDRISVGSGGAVVVHLDGGTELRLGEPTDIKQKMMDAAVIIEKYLRVGKSLEYVDASAGDRLYAKEN